MRTRSPAASAEMSIGLPAGVKVQRVPDDLTYEGLLQRIFESDQVITW